MRMRCLLAEADTDEAAAEEAAAALAAVETDIGRTTDPVRMYMREMGTVELLTREGEIEIAKRIEEGIREVMSAIAHFPGSIDVDPRRIRSVLPPKVVASPTSSAVTSIRMTAFPCRPKRSSPSSSKDRPSGRREADDEEGRRKRR